MKGGKIKTSKDPGMETKLTSLKSNNEEKIFKVAPSGLDYALKCKRCFYMERKLKIRPIGAPGYPINSRVDALLKEEFDIYR